VCASGSPSSTTSRWRRCISCTWCSSATVLAFDGAPAELVAEPTVRAVFDAEVELRIDADRVPTVRPRRRGG
jgi:hypothetical protein